MAEEREELVGGAHPKKIKACCLLLAACRLWIYLASQEFSSLVPMLAKLGRRLLADQCVLSNEVLTNTDPKSIVLWQIK